METPRTNKNAGYYFGHGIKKNSDLVIDPNGPFVLADFARELERENERLREKLDEMAAELANCAGYIASVRTDRQITWHEELYALQTVEWAEGAVEIAEKANAVLEAHDSDLANDLDETRPRAKDGC